MGGAFGEGGGGLDSDGGLSLPPKALKELERFYGFDKPIYQRYLSWLGVWPREIKHRDFSIPIGEIEIEKRVGKKDGKIWKVDIKYLGGERYLFLKKMVLLVLFGKQKLKKNLLKMVWMLSYIKQSFQGF